MNNLDKAILLIKTKYPDKEIYEVSIYEEDPDYYYVIFIDGDDGFVNVVTEYITTFKGNNSPSWLSYLSK